MTKSSQNRAFVTPRRQLLYYNQNIYKDSSYKYCKDILLTVPVVIYSRKDFYLLASLNEKIEILKAAGLIQFWPTKNFDRQLLNYQSPQPKKPLTLKHFVGSFSILVTGCLISLATFILELKLSKKH
jgi:hypothetical protein